MLLFLENRVWLAVARVVQLRVPAGYTVNVAGTHPALTATGGGTADGALLATVRARDFCSFGDDDEEADTLEIELNAAAVRALVSYYVAGERRWPLEAMSLRLFRCGLLNVVTVRVWRRRNACF